MFSTHLHEEHGIGRSFGVYRESECGVADLWVSFVKVSVGSGAGRRCGRECGNRNETRQPLTSLLHTQKRPASQDAGRFAARGRNQFLAFPP